MSKIICDICGTTYPETAEKCPICGCSRDAAAEFLGEEFIGQQVEDDAKGKAGRFAPKKKKEIFDFDEANSEIMEEPAEEENPYSEDEGPYEEKKGSNVFVVILLTVLIAVLLMAAGFIYFRYFVPNNKDEEPAATETVQFQQEEPTETSAAIPCQMLVLTSGTAELSQEGQMFLLHVKPTPEDTTDEIIFTSANESIATVTADGKVTAVAEGETEILITCGNIQTTCPVVCSFVEETVPPTTEAPVPVDTAAPETTPPETTAPPETKPSLKDVKLKLKKTDIRLGFYYEFQLELDCALEQNEVQWRSEHDHIATVDANGVVKAVKSGTTSIIAKYGDQEVSCIVRCVN